jgi:hypothetical protein
MTEAIVTARDVPAHARVTSELVDGKVITERLDAALASDGSVNCTYSKAFIVLLQNAWNAASHQRSTQVKLHHIALALIWDPEAGQEFAEILEYDAASVAVGCTIDPLTLGVLRDNTAILGPAVGTVRWISAARDIALERAGDNELRPSDLVEALRSNTGDPTVLAALKKAARNGFERRDVILGPRPSNAAPLHSAYRDPVQFIDDVDNRRTSGLLTAIEALQQLQSTASIEQKQSLAGLESVVNERLSLIDRRIQPIEPVMNKLGAIEKQIAAVDAALPRPPTVGRLATIVIAVVALGVAAGLALTLARPG